MNLNQFELNFSDQDVLRKYSLKLVTIKRNGSIEPNSKKHRNIEKVRIRFDRTNSIQFDSVRFGSIRFDSVRFGSVGEKSSRVSLYIEIRNFE